MATVWSADRSRWRTMNVAREGDRLWVTVDGEGPWRLLLVGREGDDPFGRLIESSENQLEVTL